MVNATYASPLNGLMRGQLESLFKLSKNGSELPTAKVVELDAAIFPDPGNHFAGAVADNSPLTLMEPVGLTPKKDIAKGASSAAGSLAEE